MTYLLKNKALVRNKHLHILFLYNFLSLENNNLKIKPLSEALLLLRCGARLLCRLVDLPQWNIQSKRHPLPRGHLDSVLFQYEDQQWEELKYIRNILYCFWNSISL